jgi:hypothetical protein
MEMSGQLHTPAALPPQEVFPVGIEEKAGWVPERVLEAMEKGISSTCLEAGRTEH